MIIWLCIVAFILILLIWNIDSWYLIRLRIPYLCISNRKETIKDIFRTHVFHSCVLPADLDFMGHMNNACYMHEADIAQCHFFAQYKMVQMLGALRGYMVMTANCCHFHCAVSVFEHFDIQTRILGWDDHILCLEQHFVQPSNGFVVAVVLAWFNVIGMSSAVVLECLAGKKVESPEMPEEVLHWIKYNLLSSQRMRAEGNFQNSGKDC